MQKILLGSLLLTSSIFANQNVIIGDDSMYVSSDDNKVTINGENINVNSKMNNVIIQDGKIEVGDNIKIDSKTGQVIILNIDDEEDKVFMKDSEEININDKNFPFND